MSFSKHYSKKFGRTLSKVEANSFLQNSCTVNVHDYGMDGGRIRYELNGRPVILRHGAVCEGSSRKYMTVAELRDALPIIDHGRPAWCSIRWIDVDDGMNGDIIEYLIKTLQCAKQSTFNQIVNLRQSAMALLLDTSETTDADIVNFLLISRCPGLAASSVDKFMSQVSEDGNLDGFLQSEQISFLLQISTEEKYAKGGAPGTLITFQEGLSGDDFGEVRQRLAEGSDFVAKQGAAHLLFLLTQCTIETAGDIEKFADTALLDIEERFLEQKELKNPINYKLAKKIKAECEVMHSILLPMVDAFAYLCSEKFPPEVLGNNVIAWNNLHAQVRRLDQNIMELKTRAHGQVTAVEDVQKEEAEQRSARVERSSFIMGLVLAMFSPLSFIAGTYGMNFQQPNGDPGLPELMWWPNDNGEGISGYAFFWALCGSCVALALTLYMLLGLLPNPFPDMFAMVIRLVSALFALCARKKKEQVVVAKKTLRRGSTVSVQVRPPLPVLPVRPTENQSGLKPSLGLKSAVAPDPSENMVQDMGEDSDSSKDD